MAGCYRSVVVPELIHCCGVVFVCTSVQTGVAGVVC